MLTLRKLRVATGDVAAATRMAEYVLSNDESPRAFRSESQPDANGWHDALRPSVVWSGTPRMLAKLGVERDAEVHREQLALALQGCHPVDGVRLRREGMIERPAVDAQGRALYDERGRRRQVRVKGTKTVDITFSAPKSVSVVWSQASAELRIGIEAAMLAAAAAVLEQMSATKPIVSERRVLGPAVGFAGALALHVTARTSLGQVSPAPQLHVHAVLLGAERADGLFASPELSGLFKYGAPLEGGAIGRARLAEGLVDLGFAIEPDSGRHRRFFEIRGVPTGLVQRMSPRTQDVAVRIDERETARGKSLTSRERAVAALQTRAPKRRHQSTAEILRAWRRQAEEFDFGPEAVEALRNGGSFAEQLSSRTTAVRTSASRRLQLTEGHISPGAARAAVLESATGRLRLREALTLLADLEAAGVLNGPA